MDPTAAKTQNLPFNPDHLQFPRPWAYKGIGERGHIQIINGETNQIVLLDYAIRVSTDIEIYVTGPAWLYDTTGKKMKFKDTRDIPVRKILKEVRAATMFQSKKRRIAKWYPQPEVDEFAQDPWHPLPTAHRPYPKCFVGLVATQYNAFAITRRDEDPEALMVEVNKYNLSPAALRRWIREAASWRLLVTWPDFEAVKVATDMLMN